MRTMKFAGPILMGILAIVVISALIVREFRFGGNWRICSANGAYEFDYSDMQVVFDDYRLADQVFEMRACSNKISMQACAISEIVFINPFHVNPSDIDLPFIVIPGEGGKSAIISSKDSRGTNRKMTTIYKNNGAFDKFILNEGGHETVFRECKFPLFR